jgi:hypothetical protein
LSHWRAVARQSSDETRVENVTGWIETGWPRSSRQPRPPDLRGLPHAGLPDRSRRCRPGVLAAPEPLRSAVDQVVAQEFVEFSHAENCKDIASPSAFR